MYTMFNSLLLNQRRFKTPVILKCPRTLLGTLRHHHWDALRTPSSALHRGSKAIRPLGGAKAVAGQPPPPRHHPFPRPHRRATAD